MEVASRTDRGVHARANVLAITSPRSAPTLLGALNGIAPDLWFDSAIEVPPTFRVRRARSRWYRYFEPVPAGRVAAYRAAARLFRGPVDVRSFGRGIPSEAAVTRPVERVHLTRVENWAWIDVRAPSFVHGMVRKMVASMRAVADGAISPYELKEAIAGQRRLTLPLAEPDRLVLWEVDHGLPWGVPVARPSRQQVEYRRAELRRAEARGRILSLLFPSDALRPEVRSDGPGPRERTGRGSERTGLGVSKRGREARR